MAASAENVRVVEHKDDDSSFDGAITARSEASIDKNPVVDFGTENKNPSLQDAFLHYKKKREVCCSTDQLRFVSSFRPKVYVRPFPNWGNFEIRLQVADPDRPFCSGNPKC